VSAFRLSDLLGETPAPIQLQLLKSPAFEVGMITGVGAGKTRGICAHAIQHAVKYPGAKVLMGRKTFSEMVNTVKQPFFDMAEKLHRAGWFLRPAKWDYREGTHLVRFRNGSQIFFSNLDDPIKFRNEEYSLIIADQVEELKESLWEVLTSRIRWRGPDMLSVPPEAWQAVAAANDNGHNWVWRRFVKIPGDHLGNEARCLLNPLCMMQSGHPDIEGNQRPGSPCATRQFFHGTTLDNAHNLSPRYVASLLSKPRWWQRYYIYATMEGGEGRLLPDARVVPHFDPPAHWPRWRAIDHALNSPCCCLWITLNVDGNETKGVAPGAAYVYREYWEEDSSVDQHCQRIIAQSRTEKFIITAIDPSVFGLTQSGKEGVRRSIGDLYREEGLMTVPSVRDPFARVERINIMHNRGMAVSDKCQHLIDSMPEYQAEQNKIDETFKILNKTDFHAVDALGYGLMLIPQDLKDFTLDGEVKPDYLRRTDVEPVQAAHHKNEYDRIQKIQELAADQNDPLGLKFNTAEFWKDSTEVETVGEYDPWGR